MAPKSPWNKKATPTTTNAQRKSTTGDEPMSAIDYGEVQDDEIQALEAIFGDDYERIEVKGAWSKTTDRGFKLTIRSTLDEGNAITLTIRLTATYPKTLPVLQVDGLQSYHERTQRRVNNILLNRPKQLLGESMIYDITNDIRDALDDAVLAAQQGTLPSLDDERATAEQASTALAKESQEAEAKKAQEAKDEEERILKQMVDDEINRREARKPTTAINHSKQNEVTTSDTVAFDTPATLQVGSEKIMFSEVIMLSQLSRSRNVSTHLSKLVTRSETSSLVVVKRVTIEKSRDEIMELEDVLEAAKKLWHVGLLNVLAYRIDRLDVGKSELVLCSEYADRGTLHDIMELGNLHVGRARQYTVEILEALDYLHRNGMAHGSVCAMHVAISGAVSTSPKLAEFGFGLKLIVPDQLLPKWKTTESDTTSSAFQRKLDLWHFGILVSQMFLGAEVTSRYSSPYLMLSRLALSSSFDDFLRKLFTPESKKRPSAFEVLAAEFLRTNDPVMDDEQLSAPLPLRDSNGRESTSFSSPAKRRSRHNSSNAFEAVPMSRYATDFTELGRLGKGGFGEVVKARNKLDGGIYAVKKIKQAPHLLDQVISEVMVLNRLNHPYVVRYFSTWIEEDGSGVVIEDSTTETETATGTVTDDDDDGPRMDFGYQSTGGLDFVSSAGYPQVEFGDDSDNVDFEDDDADDQGEDPVLKQNRTVDSDDAPADQNLRLRKTRSDSRKAASTLYIQMEYCERHTLRDLIRKTMSSDDSWRYLRQITEGLAHIHGHGIIHRDLKPDNVFIDVAGSPKIGDFGLATTAHQQIAEKSIISMSGYSAGEMTRSVGTTLYVAPELRSASNASYNEKVDMYSLGIIFFEMCEPFGTAMERIRAIQQIREKDFSLPSLFEAQGEKMAQGRLISCLISHKPSGRPTSTELLRSELLPLKVEDETIRQALNGLSDSRSPYHQKMMSALFSHESVRTNRVKAMAWDARAAGPLEDAARLRLRGIARHALENVFRRHGAEETRRQSVFPRSSYYANTNVVQLLDASGNLLQLPYDLTLPHARQLGRQATTIRGSYSFGNAYRDAFNGGPPKVSEEVDFDIVDHGGDGQRQLNDAEVLKVMDEIVCEMPLFASPSTLSFHLNDARVLNAILESCRIPIAQQAAVKDIISKLGFHQHTWGKIRVELRKFGLPDTTLDDLQQFDFRDVPDKAFARLRALLENATARLRTQLDTGIRYLTEIIRIGTAFGTQRKMYISPLGSVNAKFYEDSFLFQCVLERKSNRIVVAAGGRYDSLIKAYRPADLRITVAGAVGVSIGLDPIISSMAKSATTPTKKTFLRDHHPEEATSKRCDVLVLALGSESVRMTGIKLMTSLWASEISAELVTDRASHGKECNFVVTVRHEASNTVRVASTKPEADESDVPLSGLVANLQQELRDLESSKPRPPTLLRQPSHPEVERKSNVHVLIARYGSKKSNKYQIVLDAQEHWSDKLDGMKDAPILAVETRDDVLDLLQQTRLGDVESWRKAVQSVQLNDRQYVQQIQEMLASWRQKWSEGDGMREACVFNFRTQHCIYYDLGL